MSRQTVITSRISFLRNYGTGAVYLTLVMSCFPQKDVLLRLPSTHSQTSSLNMAMKRMYTVVEAVRDCDNEPWESKNDDTDLEFKMKIACDGAVDSVLG